MIGKQLEISNGAFDLCKRRLRQDFKPLMKRDQSQSLDFQGNDLMNTSSMSMSSSIRLFFSNRSIP